MKTESAGCPSGLRWDGVKCAQMRSEGLYLCERDNISECTRQCQAGHAGSCGSLGFSYLAGKGVALNRSRAASLFDTACRGGDMTSCENLGGMYLRGVGVRLETGRAVHLMSKGCEAEPRNCFNLGVMFRDREGKDNAQRAPELFSRACYGGRVDACTELAIRYATGSGVPKDGQRALELRQVACQSDGLACAHAGIQLLFGSAVPMDEQGAFPYLSRGCESGAPLACAVLGHVYYTGKGTGVDPQKGMKLLEHACHSDVGIGCGYLAQAHRDQGNDQVARQYDQKACELGVQETCGN
ncbi:MAG: SEL1-like repeat protein [Myxococcales bacterium]|nr:SEL1-like repeat protein [Myxococcales bacterium]